MRKETLEETLQDFIISTKKGMEELQERQKQTDLQINRVNKLVGDIGNRFGAYTEGFAHSSVDIILEREFNITDTVQNAKKKIGQAQWFEVDVMGVANGTTNTAVLVEIKSQLTEESFSQILKITEQFPIFYPEHRDKHLYTMLCCVAAPKKVLREKANELGIYLATVKGEVFGLDNVKGFKPKDFRKV